MKQFDLYMIKIAILNLKHSLTRTVGLVFFTAVLSFVIFGGGILMISLQNGLNTMKDRMGADIMIVPLENTADIEAILLKGEPSCFYFKKTLVEKASSVDGVELCSAQFFLTSLNAECCDAKVQLIGFDPETDFSVQPWIAKVYDRELENGAVIIGSDINAESGSTIKIYGREYPVAAQLEATGTGLDQAVFATTDTILIMYDDAYEKGQRFMDEADPTEYVSSILIRVKEGYDASQVVKDLRKELGAVQIVESQSMVKNIGKNMQQMSVFLLIFGILFIFASVVTISIINALTANERKKELSILRTLGTTRKRLALMILYEAAIIGGLGGIAGIVFSSLIVFPFHNYIGDKMSMPYLMPNIGVIGILFLITIFATILIGIISASFAAIKISASDVYLTLREGD